MLPETETRIRARRVYTNFRIVFHVGMEYRKQFWIIAKSTTENQFNAQFEVMRQIFGDVVEDLLNRM